MARLDVEDTMEYANGGKEAEGKEMSEYGWPEDIGSSSLDFFFASSSSSRAIVH